ncbi:771_t:CDS:2, partial [Funneliformis geosporum]
KSLSESKEDLSFTEEEEFSWLKYNYEENSFTKEGSKNISKKLAVQNYVNSGSHKEALKTKRLDF